MLKTLAVVIAATVSVPAFAALSVEWRTYDGSFEPKIVSITQEDVADNEYVLGYVRDLIGRSKLCYRGDAKEVMNKIVARGIAWDQAETCEELKVDKQQRITVGECTIDGSTAYSLAIGKCGN